MADVTLAEERYSHVLFQRADDYLLTYMSGGPIEVARTVQLSADLAVELAASPDQLKNFVRALLAGKISAGADPAHVAIWPAP